MSVGAWVVIIVICFIVGNVMGLKPKISEVRVGDMRLLARKLDLNPKLVATPDWLGKGGMVAQYTIIHDEWRLPAKQLKWTDGAWQNDDGVNVGLPPLFCLPFLKGLFMKANSVTVYWHDESYIKSFALKDEEVMSKVEQDLTALKAFLIEIGERLG